MISFISTRDVRVARYFGLATFETAMILAAITAICLGALALVDYLNQTDAAFDSIDREIHNSSVKATRIASDEINGGLRLSVDDAEIRNFVDRIAERALGDRVEAAYAVADIDPNSGALLAVRAPGYRRIRGDGRPLETAQCPGVESELLRFPGVATVPSILAVPDAGTSQMRFMNVAVIVLARTEIDFSDAPVVRTAISLWGMNPRITLCSAAALRGEVSLGEV